MKTKCFLFQLSAMIGRLFQNIEDGLFLQAVSFLHIE